MRIFSKVSVFCVFWIGFSSVCVLVSISGYPLRMFTTSFSSYSDRSFFSVCIRGSPFLLASFSPSQATSRSLRLRHLSPSAPALCQMLP